MGLGGWSSPRKHLSSGIWWVVLKCYKITRPELTDTLLRIGTVGELYTSYMEREPRGWSELRFERARIECGEIIF